MAPSAAACALARLPPAQEAVLLPRPRPAHGAAAAGAVAAGQAAATGAHFFVFERKLNLRVNVAV
jgi:hypothetical protein